MKKKLTAARVFVLKGYTECVDEKFFVSPTGRDRWAGPYKVLHHATTAIARKLSREYGERDRRRQDAKERLDG